MKQESLNILITRFPFESQLGGEEFHSLHLAQALTERGHNVKLLTSDPVLLELFKEHGLAAYKARIVRPPVTFWSLVLFTLLSPLYFLYLNWLVLGFWWAHRTQRNVVYMHSLPEKLLISPVAKLLGCQVVWVEHARIGNWLVKNPWVIIYRFWSMFSHIITPSQQTAEPIQWARRIHVIPHGVVFDKAIPLSDKAHKTHDKAKDVFKALCIARLSQDKGVDYLIQAVYKLISHDDKARLYIVGLGPEESHLRHLVKKLHLESHVEFLGKLSRNELRELFSQMDCLVLPSSEHDPFGLVIVEAMIMNTATICTSVCGASEFVEAGVESLVVPEKDEHALYQALKALSTNQQLCHKIADLGHKAAYTKFSHARMVDDYEQVFHT